MPDHPTVSHRLPTVARDSASVSVSPVGETETLGCTPTVADAINKHDTGGPWAPPAPGRYCLTRCYCGDCPHYLPMSVKSTNTPDAYTAIDRHAILSSTGRRTNLAEYREAQAARTRQAITRKEGT